MLLGFTNPVRLYPVYPLPGFMNPVCLYPVYPCILGLITIKGREQHHRHRTHLFLKQRHCWSFEAASISVPLLLFADRHVGVVVKASSSRAEDPEFDFGFASGFFRIESYQIDTLVATLPGAWRYRITIETGWPGVSIP